MAECPECGTDVKAAPGKLAMCSACGTKFRAPAEGSAKGASDRRAALARKPGSKKADAAPPPPLPADDETYGFIENEEDLAELRRKREEAETRRAEEKRKEEKPIIEVRRKNIGDLKVWERIDKAMIWYGAGMWVWLAAHLVFGLILFLGIVQGPEYARPVASKLIIGGGETLELGQGDPLNRPAFVIAMLGGLDMWSATLGLLVFVQILNWIKTGLWVTGSAIAWPSAPRDFGGHGQLIALYVLAGVNFLASLFFVFLPYVGAYTYCVMPWSASELAMAEYNMDRTISLHVFWSFAPFWETLLAFVLMTLVAAEPIMIAYFTWSVGTAIKEEPLSKAARSAVEMGCAVLFVLLVYQLFALAGTSSVLVKVLRVLYLVWYVGLIVWMLRLVGMVSKCRSTFRFYFFPDED